LRRGALQVERQQALQRVVGRDVFRPAVGGGDGSVEGVVRVGQPARALVVEVGQRALFELDRRLDGPRQNAVGIAARTRRPLLLRTGGRGRRRVEAQGYKQLYGPL
jgi:hypothetical protein